MTSGPATEYLSSLPFPADRFQHDAAAAIDRGASVVVTAPTGSGKTVIAEAAIAWARSSRRRAFYTTPMKALSNQKFGDLRRQHGEDAVGLLTGDNSINGSAPIVVMTTEVLRNMMYAGSSDLDEVATVILDEVHYLQDPSRGAVWEEIIIHLDRAIPLVCLSATIANPQEFAAWVAARRGDTDLVVESERPVPLESTYLLRDTWEGHTLRHYAVFGQRGRPNERLQKVLDVRGRRGKRHATPRRFETAEFLSREGLLPAIYFIFSRAGCETAASQVIDFGLRLTGPRDAAHIIEVAERRTAHLGPSDLAVLGYDRWLRTLERGVAPHHAGMVPAFKETVEELFAAGLIRLVFATETLALGINMPARTVVIENLSKFTGESHELLRPGDYTQLTGRAGRRGIDDAGTAVVLHSPYVPFDRVAGIAGAGTHPLVSSFRPSYNMAANLIATYPRETAERLLDASFARFAEERRRGELPAQIEEVRIELDDEREAAHCELGDVRELAGARSADRVMSAFAASTSAGDVLEWTSRGIERRQVVVARSTGKRPRLVTIDEDGNLHRISPDRLPASSALVGRIDLPVPIKTREAGYRLDVAEVLRAFSGAGAQRRPEQVDEHPAARCPDLERHLGALRAIARLERRLQRLERRSGEIPAGLVPRFRAIVGLLQGWGYVSGWSLTARGHTLRFIYNELDLLLAESVRAGLFGGLEPAEFVALASLFTFEPRSEPESPLYPTHRLEERSDAVVDTWERLAAQEREFGVPPSRPPEPGFAILAHRWAQGARLDELFGDDTPGVGDFVRNCRQLIDLLRQIRDVAGDLQGTASDAIKAVDRGVVAAAGAL
ncbi:MAG TPA: DEAD/DEAH box helicase [Acidimicrobiia bacterium]|nr:DEAD/DEAH box helicase [Acidimicrobiia bacterium]